MSEATISPTPLAKVLAKVGGRRGLIEGGIPPVVFAAANAIAGLQGQGEHALLVAAGAATAAALAILVLSIAQGASLIGSVRGSVLLVIAVGFALWTGSARSFFLPGIYVDALYTVGITLSVVIGRPAVGFAYAVLMGLDDSWRRDAGLRRAFTLATAAWAATYAARTAAQAWLFRADQTELLAVAKLVLGWPLTALAVLATIAAVRRARSHESRTAQEGASRGPLGADSERTGEGKPPGEESLPTTEHGSRRAG
jgi:hypothetical protein